MSKQQTKPAKKSSNDFVDDEAISAGSEGYFKPEQGDSKVRIISKPIVGWLAWDEDEDGNKKPSRTAINDQPDMSNYDKDNQPKKFMALVIIDRKDDLVKIWEMTQQSVIKAIKALSGNPDWGNPFSYDININKKGEKLKTKYTVTPSPKKPLEKNLVKAAEERPVNLDALFEGTDPFAEDQDSYTDYFFK